MQTRSDHSKATLAVHRDGFAIMPGLLSPSQIERILTALQDGKMSRARRNGSLYGGRNLLEIPALADLAASQKIRNLVEPFVGHSATPVRALFFDKTPDANWPVLWHQDLSIAVAQKHEVEGWGPWSVKAGVPHVQPPVHVLEAMVAVRLHLDDCGADNGPLRVLPGSHQLGRLSRDRIATCRQTIKELLCEAPAGTAMLMRPLLLHASSPASTPNHRRVVHIEFAPEELLPPPLAWAQRSQSVVEDNRFDY
ncbi:MAG: phytanoyl-CoA dioxygenase family protein [Alphaproteobacteria bacterium]|nr:phytanoyl-CoA dioxygenase family protein [Alphaproteobacteria bacterium]